NKKSVKVRINDRGPYIEGRLIDLSFAAAKKLGYENLGTANVRLQVIKFGDNSYKKK
ncbi:MAG: septal ring lytic transglycosylase RlpA family lipoprotein, partial [Candidatus Marinimicrobia bacterium]|nr:septal ring lytic transglycosylase RlpA family lipoprotein [Candidatus Neomarinimicrobiota bacterium]